MEYIIKRGEAGTIVATVTPTGQQSKKIMGENIVTMAFDLSANIDFQIGDYADVFGERYLLEELPDVNKVSSIQFSYTLTLKAIAYELGKVAYMMLDEDNNPTISDFPLMGNAETFIDLLIINANRVQSGWVKGTVDDTDFQNISFSNESCLSVLSTIANAYSIEWWIDGQTIHMTKKGEVEDLTFQYGMGKGLYDITRTTDTDKNIYTRLYAFGSTQNIPPDYTSAGGRLRLPGDLPYIEANVDKYGIIEHCEIFDDIKPERTGTISNVTDKQTFTDIAIDFNVNDQLLPGIVAKVVFKTGLLAGYQFEINSFDNDTKTFKINFNQDDTSLILPSDDQHAEIGDQYTLVDLNMPQIYIDDGENRILIKATNLLDQNKEPIVTYSVTCDPLNFKQRMIVIHLGNYVKVIDTDFNLNDNIRIAAFTRDLQIVSQYTMDLSQNIQMAQIVRQYNAYQTIKNAVAINKLTDVNRARLNWKTTQELRNMIFDPDGYFDGTNIRPNSIETLMLSVGAKSQQFALNGVLMSPNFQSDASQFNYTNGELVHFTISDSPVTWNITGHLLTGLTDVTAYYIYGKCSKSDNTAEIILSPTVIKPEGIAGYYHFLIGVLHSVIDGVRGISLTYGQTTTNGRFLTTGRVQSADGVTYFDLDDGVIGGKIVFAAGSSGYANLTDKPDLSIYAINDFVTAALAGLQSQIDGEITTWFYDYEPDLTNEPAVDWTDDDTKNKHLGDLFYSSVTGYAYRFNLVTGVYSWVRIADTDITLALSNAAAAQDTADHKRRVFLTTPATPYDAGDLWAGGASADLKRCITGRSSGAYNSADWELATKYTDDTTADIAVANAANAQATADAAYGVTSYLFTTISGNLVATGTLLVGDATHNNAGITGVTDNGDDSVRFFAGDVYANKNTAPFRVLNSGKLYATDAVISGEITADTGKIGNWNITSQGLENISANDASIVQVKTFTGGKTKEARVGTNIGGVGLGTYVAVFINEEPGTTDNVALFCRASGASSANEAAIFQGSVDIDNETATGNATVVRIHHLPSTATMAGFGTVVARNSDGRLYLFF